MAPEGWTRYKVSDLLTDDAPGYWGSTPSGTGDVAVLRSTNLTDDHRLNISNVALRSFPEKKILEKKLEPGDLLLERSGGGPNRPVGRIAYFNHESCFCYSNFMQRLRPDQRRVRPEFLAYLLSHLHLSGVTLLMQQATTGIRNLNYREYLAHVLLVPPLPEQRKIAAILSSVDDALEKAQAVIDQLRVVKRGLMQGLLTRSLPGRHTRRADGLLDEWSLKRVGELGEVVTGSTPSTKNDTFWNGSVPFVTPIDLGSTKRVSVTRRYVTRDGLAQVRRIPPGAVMVTCIASIGKIGIADVTCCTNQQINSIIPNRSVVLSEYLYYAISFMSDALARLAGTTAVPIVSKSKFLTFGVMVPPVAEQKKIVKMLSGVDQAIDANRAWRVQLLRTKLGLMSVLLTGELQVAADPEVP